jgi:hypothetical protein
LSFRELLPKYDPGRAQIAYDARLQRLCGRGSPCRQDNIGVLRQQPEFLYCQGFGTSLETVRQKAKILIEVLLYGQRALSLIGGFFEPGYPGLVAETPVPPKKEILLDKSRGNCTAQRPALFCRLAMELDERIEKIFWAIT